MDVSRICIVLGVGLVLVGLSLKLFPKGFELFAWFGRLPGDISFKSDSITVWIPITSMVIVSILLSAAIKLLQRLLG